MGDQLSVVDPSDVAQRVEAYADNARACGHGGQADDLDRAATLILSLQEQLARASWQGIESAPKDGSYILAIVAPGGGRYLEHQAGRAFVIRHEGVSTVGAFDLGWAVYPGFGGASDANFSHWMPLPSPPARSTLSPEPPVRGNGGKDA